VPDLKKECEAEMVEEHMLDNPAYRQMADMCRVNDRPDVIRDMNRSAQRIRAQCEATLAREYQRREDDFARMMKEGAERQKS
jgi:hypothetical protein